MARASKFTIAIRLRNEWKEASRLKDRHDGTFGTAEAEQKAWDACLRRTGSGARGPCGLHL